MKKVILLFGVVASVFVLMPSSVYAAEPAGFVETSDGVYVNEQAISAGRYGTFEAGDVSWTYESAEDEADGVKTWNYYLTVGSVDFEFLYMSLVPTGVDIDAVTPGDSFLMVHPSNDNGITTVLLQATGSLNEGDRVLLFTVRTVDQDGAEECLLETAPLNLDCSVNVPGFYFDNDGNEISAEEYAQVCGNVTPDDGNDVPSPETGSVIPYIAIGGGIVALIAVYLLTRKSSKVYKI